MSTLRSLLAHTLLTIIAVVALVVIPLVLWLLPEDEASQLLEDIHHD